MHQPPGYRFLPEETDELLAWARQVESGAPTPFDAARKITQKLGAHYRDGKTTIGFWAPEISPRNLEEGSYYLEVFTPRQPINFAAHFQELEFAVAHLPLVFQNNYLWGVFTGLQPGQRHRWGIFYWVRYRDTNGQLRTLVDPLSYSVPFGVFAPAELYDMETLQAERADHKYFLSHFDIEFETDGIPRVRAPVNILQLHIGTATAAGTFEGLTRLFRTLSEKRKRGETLEPAERNYAAYEAVQFMPIEPTIEFTNSTRFWAAPAETHPGETVTVRLTRPHNTNWGYDVMLYASSAPTPVYLETGRPDELVDLIAELHNSYPHPIKVIFDVVFGHIDNASLPLMNPHFIAGPGMYGQEVNFQHPVVRAILLEMQRRKVNFGADGVRVDGAQDFKYWDKEKQNLVHDDEYLGLMNKLEQQVAGQTYRPWMIFEDGRPWPRADWELASTYREVTRQYPNVFQWGPLTFAHNTPFLFTFWASKLWRIREIIRHGSRWITGCANHDTLRRGTQVDPEARINTYLGGTLPDILRNAYDNPAAKLLDYACMPGVPMEFINAAMQAPWSFIRNTDEQYAVKVVAEESRFLDWAVEENQFKEQRAFQNLKAIGFSRLEDLKQFMGFLAHAVKMTGGNPSQVVKLLNAVEPYGENAPFSENQLKAIARAWMDDLYAFCNVGNYINKQDEEHTRFNYQVREFRRARPWLQHDLGTNESFGRLENCEGSIVFFGLRRSPHDYPNPEEILFVANMEGAPVQVQPVTLPIPGLAQSGWRPVLTVPGVRADSAEQFLTLRDSQGVVFCLPGN